MNTRILIAAAAAIGSTLVLPASPVAAQDASNCQSPNAADCLPCEWDDSILAGSPDCYEPCEYDPSIAADSSSCDPCLYPDSSTSDPSCDETTTTVPQETTTTTSTTTSTTVPDETTTTTSTTSTTSTTLSDTTTSTTLARAESGTPTTAVAGDADAVRSAPVVAATPTAQLPETGGNGTTAAIALVFLAAGAALVAASRRPQIS